MEGGLAYILITGDGKQFIFIRTDKRIAAAGCFPLCLFDINPSDHKHI